MTHTKLDDDFLNYQIALRLFRWDCLRANSEYKKAYKNLWLPIATEKDGKKWDENKFSRVINHFWKEYRITEPLAPLYSPRDPETKELNFERVKRICQAVLVPLPVQCLSYSGQTESLFEAQFKKDNVILAPLKKIYKTQSLKSRRFTIGPTSREDLENTTKLSFELDLSYTDKTIKYWLQRELDSWKAIHKALGVKKTDSGSATPINFHVNKQLLKERNPENKKVRLDIDLSFNVTQTMEYFRLELRRVRKSIRLKNKLFSRVRLDVYKDKDPSFRKIFIIVRRQMKHSKLGALKAAASILGPKVPHRDIDSYHRKIQRRYLAASRLIEKRHYKYVK